MPFNLPKWVALRGFRGRLGVAALSAAFVGSYMAVGQQPSRGVADIPARQTLRAKIGDGGQVILPIESLPAVHGLDLSEPAKTELRLSRRSKVEPKPTTPTSKGPILVMPSLVEPSNAPLDNPLPGTPQPETTAAQADSDDAPPTAPEQFEPQWRPSGKGTASKTDSSNTRAPLVLKPVQAPEKSEQPEPLVLDTKSKDIAPETKPRPLAQPDKAVAKLEKPAAKPDKAETTDKLEPADESAVVVDDAELKPEVEITPAEPLKPLTRNQIYLRNKMRKVLSYYYRKTLNSRDHDTWEAMHMMLAYGLHSRIQAGGPRGESMTAIGWLCYNNPCKNKQLMILNDEGEIRAQYGVGLQGHMGQFLAMLAQCNVDPDYPIRVEGKEFTIHDLIESEKKTCYPNTELTFKLIALMHYLPSDSQWVNDRGEQWSIEKLIEEELKQPIRGAACGGTHRLGGLSLAVRKREKRGEPVTGVWLQAKQFTDKYEQYLYRLQNPDGSFSTEWFRGPGRESDIDRRCRTSGHLLEWALYHADDDQLTSYRIVKATNYLTNLLYSNSNNEWEIGPQAHALHALSVYDQRVFQPHDKVNQEARSGESESDKPQWVSESQKLRTIPRQSSSASRSNKDNNGWWWNR